MVRLYRLIAPVALLAPLALTFAASASAFALAHPSASPTLHARASPTTNTTITTFLTTSVNAFFPAPGNDGWAAAFDLAFAPNVSAHFNDGAYDFTSFKAYFAAIQANLAAKYESFEHGFETVVGAAAADGSTGGFGIVTGWEGGVVQGVRYYGTDGAFAVVREFDGQLKITEVSGHIHIHSPLTDTSTSVRPMSNVETLTSPTRWG